MPDKVELTGQLKFALAAGIPNEIERIHALIDSGAAYVRQFRRECPWVRGRESRVEGPEQQPVKYESVVRSSVIRIGSSLVLGPSKPAGRPAFIGSAGHNRCPPGQRALLMPVVSEFGITGRPWKRRHVADVGHAGDE